MNNYSPRLFNHSEVDTTEYSGWPVYGGDTGHQRYSSLSDIHHGNVDRLEIAWTYRHGDVRKGGMMPDKTFKGSSFEATPLVVEGRLIFSTPFNRVIALHPETGEELWIFDPQIDKGRRFANAMISRGVSYWRDLENVGFCASRIYLATLDARLIALDTDSGLPCPDFGINGTVNLLDGVAPLTDPWEYNVTSPPAIVGDRVIVGSSLADLVRRVQPHGFVRAFDARSGALLWTFNTIPQHDEFGTDTWDGDSWKATGGANVWSIITVDEQREMVFLPVSAAGPDFYGGDRKGDNLFANSLVALDARTGKRRWHFQTVHHDIWDNDVGSPPMLVTINRGTATQDVVVQLTKMGLVFVLDRETGAPVFPVEERPVPQTDIDGEQTSPTQPFPAYPPPLVPLRITADDLWQKDLRHHEACLAELKTLRNEGIYTPPSLEGSILYPGNGGGANWSGGAYDPVNNLLYVPLNNMAMTIQLEKLSDKNYDDEDGLVLQTGWSALRWALTWKGTGLRYKMIRKRFEYQGQPCIAPPWGTLAAVDLGSGSVRWQVPVGLDESGIRGLPNAGPVLVTAGGLVFHGGTKDQRLWAYDADSGEVLAHFELPAALHAGPITYKMQPDGKQFIVVAPGGHIGLGTKLGDYIIAYTLPEQKK